jgi:hypothetical protein
MKKTRKTGVYYNELDNGDKVFYFTYKDINDLDINANASLDEIINSAWKNRLSWEAEIFDDEGNFNEKYLYERKKLNKLTLKAIEYANLTKEYNDFINGAEN